MSSLSSPLQRSLIAKDILSTLRYEIVSGELKEGEYLREVAISKRMNVSRGPVRRALQQLEAEGLVVSEENGRTSVVGISNTDIDDIYDLRLILEKKAVLILRDKDFVDYTPILESLNHLKQERDKGPESDPVVAAGLGYDVHVAIMKCSGNKAIFNAWKSLSTTLQLIMEMNGNYVESERAFASHKLLVDAIIQKREDIERVIEQHLLQDSKDIYLSGLHKKAENEAD
ncbi:MAG: GntR family transcriptional regulator [Lachnospiraceae bacterium]|jgi:DNA-binding GntR family transcriptional regulator|nr:GntR family transcriptional regulator [Lachnospiraceae bacterium]